jgi:CheY-like chemotaxis protein
MDENVMARLFEPFFTTKDRDKGTGLGLATVFGIVKQSGGSIDVHSECGAGSSFKIYLPAVTGASSAAAVSRETTDLRGSETVLVVEDQRAILVLVQRILSQRGYTVLTASDSNEALACVRANPGRVNLLITDVILPGVSGPQLVRQMRDMRPGLRVLYMSGYAEHAAIQRDVLDCDAGFLQKPFTPDALAERVRHILDLPQLQPMTEPA